MPTSSSDTTSENITWCRHQVVATGDELVEPHQEQTARQCVIAWRLGMHQGSHAPGVPGEYQPCCRSGIENQCFSLFGFRSIL